MIEPLKTYEVENDKGELVERIQVEEITKKLNELIAAVNKSDDFVAGALREIGKIQERVNKLEEFNGVLGNTLNLHKPSNPRD